MIGDRAFGTTRSGWRGSAAPSATGLLAGGVLPVIKHIPGHGRARVDSHRALPRVEAEPRRAGAQRFRAVPRAVGDALGDDRPYRLRGDRPRRAGDLFGKVIDDIIRGDIGFDGVLFSDDISMGALDGTLANGRRRALDAGCDLVLHCNGVLDEMREIAAAAPAALAEAADGSRMRARRQDIAAGRSRQRVRRRRGGAARFAALDARRMNATA